MKLFQQLLVATASLGLITPIAAQASDIINLEGMNDYKRGKTSPKRLDSNSFANEVNEDLATFKTSEQDLNPSEISFEAGSFSDTTTMDGKAVFTLGAVNSPDHGSQGSLQSEATLATYMLQSNLNTSFTGDDNLYIRLKSGNSTAWQTSKTFGTYLSSAKGNGDDLKVDKIWYTFPLGENNTFWVGPKIENYYMHGTTPSIYKPITKQFTLGGNGAAYGASTNPGVGWAYKADNGFAISSNVVSDGDNTDGWGTSDSATSWATQIGYTKPNYSASVILNLKYNGWVDEYYSTANGKLRPTSAGASTGGDSTNIGFRYWWRPDDSGTAVPSVSLGYDTSETDASTNSNTTAYFVGLTWQDAFTPDDRIGVAFGQPQTREDETVDAYAWEAYYSYQLNDSVTVTPAVFGGQDRSGTDYPKDIYGAVLETTFKF